MQSYESGSVNYTSEWILIHTRLSIRLYTLLFPCRDTNLLHQLRSKPISFIDERGSGRLATTQGRGCEGDRRGKAIMIILPDHFDRQWLPRSNPIRSDTIPYNYVLLAGRVSGDGNPCRRFPKAWAEHRVVLAVAEKELDSAWRSVNELASKTRSSKAMPARSTPRTPEAEDGCLAGLLPLQKLYSAFHPLHPLSLSLSLYLLFGCNLSHFILINYSRGAPLLFPKKTKNKTKARPPTTLSPSRLVPPFLPHCRRLHRMRRRHPDWRPWLLPASR